MVAITSGRRAAASDTQTILEENNTFMKVASFIPFIGMIPSLFQEKSLATQLEHTNDPVRCIALIEVKNQYKVANVVRDIMEGVLLIVGIASRVLAGGVATCVFISIAFSVLAGIHIYRIGKNEELIQELSLTGFRPGMRFF